MRTPWIRGLLVAVALLAGACSSDDDDSDTVEPETEETVESSTTTSTVAAAEPPPCPVEDGDEIPLDIGSTGCTLDGDLVEWDATVCTDDRILVQSDLGYGYEGLLLVADLSEYERTRENFCV